jgi:MFS transporter, DHA1 family, tetracycline resistance protein
MIRSTNRQVTIQPDITIVTPERSSVILIFIIVLIDTMGLGIIYPVLPRLIETLTGEDISGAARTGGWLTAAYAIMQFICAPIVGSLSDTIGRRPVLILCLAGFVVDYLFLAIAPNIGLLFAGRLIAGIFGASFTAASAYIADITSIQNRTKYFGLLNAAYGLGFVLGPVIGALFGSLGERVPFIFAAAFSFVCVLLVYFILPESLQKQNRRSFSWKQANPVAALYHLKKYAHIYRLLTSYFIASIAGFVIMSTWAFFTIEKFHWSIIQIGFSLGALGLISALMQTFATVFFTHKFGNWKTMQIGLLSYVFGLLIFAFANQPFFLYIAMIPYCLGGISLPALQAVFSNIAGNKEQGEIQGILTSTESASGIIGPPLMSSIFAYFTGTSAPIHFSGAAFVFAAFLILISFFLINIKINLP